MRAADGGHGTGAVGFHDFAGDADGVGIGGQREHRFDGAFGQRAVADFAAAGAADAAGFADGVVGEVVVEDEFLGGFAAGVGVEFLGVFGGAEGDEGDGLGFAAGEDGRAMRARAECRLRRDGADVVEAAAIQALAFLHDQAADGFLLDVVKGLAEDGFGDFFRAEFGDQLGGDIVGDGFDGGFALQFFLGEKSGDNAFAGQGFGFLENVVRHDGDGDVALFLAGAGGQVFLGLDQGLAAFVAEFEGGHEIGLGDFLGGAFEHHHVGGVADVDEVQVALVHLGVGGVGDEFAGDASDAQRAERAVPGDIAHAQGGGSADDGEDVRIVFAVGAEEDALDLDFVEPAFGKERADGAVGQAAGEDFLFRGASFAFEVAAGEFAGGGGFFAVIHREREEILAGLGLAGGDGGDEDDGFAELDGDGAVGLFGEFAGFDDDLIGADVG